MAFVKWQNTLLLRFFVEKKECGWLSENRFFSGSKQPRRLTYKVIHNDLPQPAFLLHLGAKKEKIFFLYIFIIIVIIGVLSVALRRYCYLVIIWSMEMEIGSVKNVEREAFPRDTQRVFFGFTGFILPAVWSRRFQVVGIQARKRVAQIVSGR